MSTSICIVTTAHLVLVLILIFIRRSLSRIILNQSFIIVVWKWCGVVNHGPVVHTIAVSPPKTLHKQQDEVRKSPLHHGEACSMRQQSTSIMYNNVIYGQSWDADDATKVVTSFSLLQDTGKPWRRNSTNKSQKMQHLGVRCFTLNFCFLLLHSSSRLFHGQEMTRATNCFFTMDWNEHMMKGLSRDSFLFSLQTLGPKRLLFCF